LLKQIPIESALNDRPPIPTQIAKKTSELADLIHNW